MPDLRSWIVSAAAEIATRAERELEALVGVSSPSGDVAAAEEVVAIVSALVPAEASVERPACSTPGHAPDLLASLPGTGDGRLLLLGHLDTVVSHAEHHPLRREGARLLGPGAIDMKGGIALALGVMGAFAARDEAFERIDLLAVNDEEWRVGGFAHGPRFEGHRACLCFEGGQLGPDGEDAVVVRRKAAGTLRVGATGVAAHSGAAPGAGRNALLALAEVARRIAAVSDPEGPEHLTTVPTVLHSGDAFNVVPAAGELVCDLRAGRLEAFGPVLDAVPQSIDGVELEAELVRRWPGMDTAAATAEPLRAAEGVLGRAIVAGARGGASDASHVAAHVPLTLDGLGPLGGEAHAPGEFVLRDSLRTRAEVALAISVAALGLAG